MESYEANNGDMLGKLHSSKLTVNFFLLTQKIYLMLFRENFKSKVKRIM
jgi:hypothetical protein